LVLILGASGLRFGVGQLAKRTCSFNGRALCVISLPGLFAPLWSRACGVAQAHNSTVFRLLSVLPAALLPFCAGVPAMGVGQDDRHETAARSGP
jgi:hypothetical protein